LAAAFADGAGSTRATGDAGGETTTTSETERAAPGTNGVVQWTDDQKWKALGGPWGALYHRFASLIAIGVGEGEPHREHFDDPFKALQFFRHELDDRYRTDATLRRECKIVYKDNWYMVEAFADDADAAVQVLKDEVARDRRSGAAT